MGLACSSSSYFHHAIIMPAPKIHAVSSKKSIEKVLSEMAGKEYSLLKKNLADILINEITPVGKEIKKLLNDKSHLIAVLKKGSAKAHIIAEENLKNIRDKVGLI